MSNREVVYVYRPNDLHSEYLSPSGAMWTYEIASHDSLFSVCEECNADIENGWLCLDGGDFLCDECVMVVNPVIGEKLKAEFYERLDFHNAFVEIRSGVGRAVVDLFANTINDPARPLGFPKVLECEK